MFKKNAHLLRLSLTGNGMFSVITGSIAVIWAAQLAEVMGVPTAALWIVGGGVILFGIITLINARREVINRKEAALTVLADLGWVAGAIVLMLWPAALTAQGIGILAAVTAVVLLFAINQWRGIIWASENEPERLVTSVEIDATPEEVWEVIVDLDDYQEWNPFIIEGSGKIAEGERLGLKMSPPGGKELTFKPVVTEANPGSTLEWLGSLGFKGVFDGRHSFEIEGNNETTKLVHSEEFSGLLVPFFDKVIDVNTRAGFEAMNQAMKQRLEKQPA